MRWLRFSAVGALGIAVQTGALALLVRVLGMHYLLATLLAVEATVLHNFYWHKKWTWADRCAIQISWMPMLARFHLTAGLISTGGNLLLMSVLVGYGGLPAVPANMVSIACCSAANFVASNRLVFTPRHDSTVSQQISP